MIQENDPSKILKNVEVNECSVVMPESIAICDYRQMLISHIIAKVVGSAKVLISGNQIKFSANKEQESRVQCLINECAEEVDCLISQVMGGYLKSRDLLPDRIIPMYIKRTA